MKKIFAFALAVVMVLSIASVAGALWEPTPADPATDFRIQVSVEKYALETGVYGWRYVEDQNITAANGADVYYVIKLVVPSNPNAEEAAATIDVNFSGIDATNGSWDLATIRRYADGANSAGTTTGTFYYIKDRWYTAENLYARSLDVVAQARCYDTSVAGIKVEASSARDFANGETFQWKGYTVTYYVDSTTYDGNDVIRFEKGGDYIDIGIAPDGQAYRVGSSVTNVGDSFESKLYNALGFTYGDLDGGNVYMTKKNLRTVFGFSYSVSDSVDWTATNYPIIVDTNVGIPKTGDNASVIGFAMIMVAVVAAAVAVRKVNA